MGRTVRPLPFFIQPVGLFLENFTSPFRDKRQRGLRGWGVAGQEQRCAYLQVENSGSGLLFHSLLKPLAFTWAWLSNLVQTVAHDHVALAFHSMVSTTSPGWAVGSSSHRALGSPGQAARRHC